LQSGRSHIRHVVALSGPEQHRFSEYRLHANHRFRIWICVFHLHNSLRFPSALGGAHGHNCLMTARATPSAQSGPVRIRLRNGCPPGMPHNRSHAGTPWKRSNPGIRSLKSLRAGKSPKALKLSLERDQTRIFDLIFLLIRHEAFASAAKNCALHNGRRRRDSSPTPRIR
jgi:hypothetical protein